MKKKKNQSTPQQTPIKDKNRQHIENQLKRRDAKLKKEALKREKKLNDVFRKRVRESSDKKAIKTVRTKAYYRFAKDYPSTVDPEGFRENRPQKKKLSGSKKFIVFLCSLAVFILTFLICQVCIDLSEKPLTDDNSSEITIDDSIRAVHFTYQEISSLSAGELADSVNKASGNTAIVSFKDEKGYVYFDTEAKINAAANRIIPGGTEKITAIREAGIKTCAYISCYKDTAAASSDAGYHIKSLNNPAKVFYDEKMNGWLDPLNDAAVNYLLDLIVGAKDMGFDYILLDNVCFPSAFQGDAPAYSGEAEKVDGKYNALINFINSAINLAGGDKIIIMGDVSFYGADAGDENEKYGGPLFSEKCLNYAFDSRMDRQNPSAMPDSDLFRYTEDMPSVFYLDAGKIAFDAISEHGGTGFALIDKNLPETAEYMSYCGFENIIYW